MTDTRHDIAALLLRAAAALETPGDLTDDDFHRLTEDLVVAADAIDQPYPKTSPSGFLQLSTRQALEALRLSRNPAWNMLSNRYVKTTSEIGETLAQALGAELSVTLFGLGAASIRLRMPEGVAELPEAFRVRDFPDPPEQPRADEPPSCAF
ncbi:MAG TPA: hypothetical protein P5256_00655 [Beijerinckiaceae bacterium]|nr:hypothetical protein [Rhodoblastus sp.]MCC2107922.1 hypothetical protein [Hyphomicrobiales bacterium]HRY01605.1 hypothetical protein [Beijerinckiaceae bacterium]